MEPKTWADVAYAAVNLLGGLAVGYLVGRALRACENGEPAPLPPARTRGECDRVIRTLSAGKPLHPEDFTLTAPKPVRVPLDVLLTPENQRTEGESC